MTDETGPERVRRAIERDRGGDGEAALAVIHTTHLHPMPGCKHCPPATGPLYTVVRAVSGNVLEDEPILRDTIDHMRREAATALGREPVRTDASLHREAFPLVVEERHKGWRGWLLRQTVPREIPPPYVLRLEAW